MNVIHGLLFLLVIPVVLLICVAISAGVVLAERWPRTMIAVALALVVVFLFVVGAYTR